MTGFRYVQEYTDNRGKRRRYFRRGGVRISLPGEPGSPEFNAAYAAALQGYEAKRSRGAGRKPKQGTIAALIASYYASPEFQSLKLITQQTYRNIIEPFRETHGEKPVDALPRSWIKKEMGRRAETPTHANNWLKRLRQLLDHAIDLEWIEHNPARTIKLIKTRGGYAEWPEELIAQFEEKWPVGTRQRLAFDLLLYTGQRRSDVVRMSRSHIRDGSIRVVQQKTGEALWLPIHARLWESLKSEACGRLFFLETGYERPFSAAGFGNWFRDQCNAAGIEKGYSAHGLRKAAGRRLADAGCTAHQIMAVLGHRSLAEATRYTQGADQRRNAEAAFARIGTDEQQKLSSAGGGVSSNSLKVLK